MLKIKKVLRKAKKLLGDDQALSVQFVANGKGWLSEHLPAGRFQPPPPADAATIERRANETQSLGPKPLWDGYKDLSDYPRETSGSRSPNQVRSRPVMGSFFAWLTAQRRPEYIVEFGTAFGVSGMYWLSGLKQSGRGQLLTFEPNEIWGKIARENLAAIHNRFTSVIGTFEDNIAKTLPEGGKIDIAFVDAIHTDAFVTRQFDILSPLMRPGGIICFDDIAFSDDMAACWQRIARDRRVLASATVSRRLGVVELIPAR
jgi:predicted O-methyltransferase YrrM